MKIKEDLIVKDMAITLKKPKYMKIYIADPETIESIVINNKEYKIIDIIKKVESKHEN